jgi:hypothetical protein
MYVVPACPVATIRAEARYAAQHPSLTFKLWRLLREAWQRRLDQQRASLLERVGHPGILADSQRASRG